MRAILLRRRGRQYRTFVNGAWVYAYRKSYLPRDDEWSAMHFSFFGGSSDFMRMRM